MEQPTPKGSAESSLIVRVVPIIAFGFLMIAFGVLAAVFSPLVLPPEASAEAARVDGLFKVLIVIGGAIFLLVQGLLLYSVIAFRRRPGDDTDAVPVHGNPTLEIVWTVIPSIIVIFLSIAAFNVWNTNTAPRENENFVNGVPIPVTGHGARFAWSFDYDITYSAADGEEQGAVISSRFLHTYVGQHVRIDLQTDDVIHSFWVPAMRIKQDLLPGRVTEVRFTPTMAGEYPIICAELCGSGHGLMNSTLIVHPDEASYTQAFLDPQVDLLINPPADPVSQGQQIIQTYECAGCHTLSVLGWTGITGPSLDGIGERAGRRGDVVGLPAEEYIIQSIRQSNAYLVPGYEGVMPLYVPAPPDDPNYMSQDDLIRIVAFLCAQTDGAPSACNATITNLLEVTDRYENP
jgi:cytochrome c oxidase subunit II